MIELSRCGVPELPLVMTTIKISTVRDQTVSSSRTRPKPSPRLSAQRIALGVCLFLSAVTAPGALSQPAAQMLSHEAWDRGDGLAQTTVTAMAIASPGYLLVGTQGGLSRFDGTRFTNYPAANSSEQRHFVTSLAADGDAVWVGSRRGLLRYRHGTLTPAADSGPLATSYVRSLMPTEQGLLVGLRRGGLLVRLPNGEVTSVAGVDQKTFRAIARDASGRLLAGAEDGLYEITPSSPTWLVQNLMPGVNVRAIATDRSGTCIGTDSGALLCKDEAGSYIQHHHLPAPISSLLFASDQELWIATNGAGVWRHTDGQLHAAPASVPVKFSFALLRDAAENIWVGSRHGLVRLQHSQVLSLGAEEGLPDDFARTVLQTGNQIWVGTGAGLAVADWPMVERFRRVPLDGSLGAIQVRALHRSSEGKLRVGTRSGVQVQTRSGFRSDPTLDRLANATINSFAEATDGSLWIGTSSHGAWRTSADGLEQTLENTTVRTLLTTGGTTWVGSERGLWYHADGVLKHYSQLGPQTIVLSLEADGSDNGIWVGTASDGVLKIDSEGKLAPRSANIDGPVFSISQIKDDLYFSTPTGIVRIASRELEAYLSNQRDAFSMLRWDESSGMRSSESNGGSQPAAWRDDNDTLWVATIAGVVAVDAERAVEHKQAAPIWLEEVRFDGVAVPLRPTNDEGSNRPLLLPAGKRNLDITFTGAQYTLPSQINFRYRLVGFDDAWKDVGRQTRATFTNLPPGSYSFEVQAKTGAEWQSPGASLDLKLESHLFERRSAWVVPSLLLIAGLLLAWRLRESNSKRQRRELEALVEERTAALAAANQELAGLARTDSLTRMANRRWFDRRLAEEWYRAARGTPISLLMIDIDNFKSVNDRYGHLAGDACLRGVAQVIAGEVRRAGDFVARFGGEEFVAILPDTDAATARLRADAVRAAIAGSIFPYDDAKISLTVSCGVATCLPGPGASVENALEAADQALYRAKQAGKNCVRDA